MDKPLFLCIGKSGSGKSTITNILSYVANYTVLFSYTNRSPRYVGEVGHIFVTDEEFDQLENIVAFTQYDDKKYAATKEQVDGADFYIIDVIGVETLLKKYHTDRQIIVLYFDTNVNTRINRMTQRSDSESSIIARLSVDEEYDWQERLGKIVWAAKNNENINVDLRVINANQDIDIVVKNVMNVINSYITTNSTQEEN